MITGIRATFHIPQTLELRIFLRDKLGLPSFDVGDGWLIFPMEGEVAFRASDDAKQEIALRCDDIDATVAELRERGVEFKGQIQDWDDGYGTLIVAPGGVLIQLYEPACAARI